jgi:hypothetical protein
MHSIPSGPQFDGFAPTSLGLFAMIAVGLAFVAFVVITSVILAAGVQVVSSRKIKSFAAMMLFIVPALAVVGMIGTKLGTARVVTYPYPAADLQTNQPPSKPKPNSVIVARRGTGKMVKSVSTSDEAKTKAAVIVEIEDGADEPGNLADVIAAPTASVTSADAEEPLAVGGAGAAHGAACTILPLTGVLRVRGTASAPPDWADKGPVPRGEGSLVALSSGRYATIGEAEENVTALAVEYLKKFYGDEYPLRGDWTVPVSVIDQSGLDSIVGEVFDKDFGNGVSGKMYRAHLRLDIGPALRDAVHTSWHDQVVAQRLTELGGVFGLATLMLATVAGYLRLDKLTSGQYRRRLKLAAASLIAAGGLVAWQVLA